MRRLERLYAVTEELRRHEPGSVTAAWLADRFMVSTRTIERDLATLRNAGVPVGADRGRRGGYRIDAGQTWTPVALNPAEMAALLLAQAAAVGMPFADAARSATAKLTDALPSTTRCEVDQLRRRIRVVNDSSRDDRQIRRTIEQAVRLQRVIRIGFVDRHGVRTDRDVEAAGFYGAGDGWSLIAWCGLRDAGRLFRLDHITTATLTTTPNPPRDLDEILGWVPSPTAIPE